MSFYTLPDPGCILGAGFWFVLNIALLIWNVLKRVFVDKALCRRSERWVVCFVAGQQRKRSVQTSGVWRGLPRPRIPPPPPAAGGAISTAEATAGVPTAATGAGPTAPGVTVPAVAGVDVPTTAWEAMPAQGRVMPAAAGTVPTAAFALSLPQQADSPRLTGTELGASVL